jgi:DNA repair protein SbcC/Rad50
MIPYKLSLSGFLSYQDPAELDFSGFELACVSGSNGAGKSSLLDAITWVLFGEARCRDDDALINSHVNVAEVVFEFGYEGNVYRVQRSKPRGKTTILELYVQSSEGGWRALTEKSVRETENRLRQTLRMDYETFINASFFLQGRADQFAQQQASNRKKVLSSVLGLEIWETYRAQAIDQRKGVEAELKAVQAQISDIDAELAQEGERKQRLAEIEQRLAQLSEVRQTKEASLAVLQHLVTSLSEQKRLLEMMRVRLAETRSRCQRMMQELESLKAERTQLKERIKAADSVEQAYQRWQTARSELVRWDQMAASFHEIQAQRAGPLAEIAAEQSRFEEERRSLLGKAELAKGEQTRLEVLERELPALADAQRAVQEKLDQRSALEEEAMTIQQQTATMDAENRQLKSEMTALKERITRLKDVEGALCPLCGQPLSPEDRLAMLEGLEADGKRMGDTYRLNQTLQRQGEDRTRELKMILGSFARLEEELRATQRKHDALENEAERLRKSAQTWNLDGAVRLAQLEETLAVGNYAPAARTRLAEIDSRARELGYDAAAHDATRREELAGRAAEQARREVEAARAALEPLERQVAGLETQVNAEAGILATQEAEYIQSDEKYRGDAASLPDMNRAEKEVMAMKSEENRLRMDTGMVRQLVAVLDGQRERKTRLNAKREDHAQQINRLKALERAFSKDGVPALLIEQALPEIETQANDILERLSGGSMSIRFATQRQLKSKDEKRETLDILISDSAGMREYEMFSGGEAFRINFAIRLALSRVLAHRAGARLQTLFIDEGFGSQDAEGRARLIEAINLVRPEFSRILVITHMEELKEYFPARVEIEKTPSGSQIRVMV